MRLLAVIPLLFTVLFPACVTSSDEDANACTLAKGDEYLELRETGGWKDFNDAIALAGWPSDLSEPGLEAALPKAKSARDKVASEDWSPCATELKPEGLAAIDAVVTGMEAAIAGDMVEASRQDEIAKQRIMEMRRLWGEIRSTPDPD